MGAPEAVAQALLERGAVVIRPNDPFKFASGILSPIYCDNRLLLSDPARRDIVIDGLAEEARKWNSDVIAGTATAGIAWGAWIAERLKKPFAYIRAQAKDHGKGKRIEGEIKGGEQVIVVEDLISTGGSVLSAVDAVLEEGAKVRGVLAIFTYGFPDAINAFASKGIELRTLVNLDQMLGVAMSMGKITTKERALVEHWRKSPKTWGSIG